VSSTPRPHFTPGKDPVPILEAAGWAPGPVWTGGKSRPHWDSIPDCPACSQSLYDSATHTRTHTHTHTYIYIYIYTYIYLSLNLGARWGGWSSPRLGPLYPQERPRTHCTGGWADPRAGMDGYGKSRSPHRDSIPGPSTELSRSTYV